MSCEKPPNDMLYERHRLKSFKRWPFDETHACNAPKMAEAGFYFVGNDTEPDLVECFLCNKKLNGWEEEDDPWSEHKSHAQYCLFSQIGKAENDMTISEFLQICHQFSLNNLEKDYNNHMYEFKKEVKMLTCRASII